MGLSHLLLLSECLVCQEERGTPQDFARENGHKALIQRLGPFVRHDCDKGVSRSVVLLIHFGGSPRGAEAECRSTATSRGRSRTWVTVRAHSLLLGAKKDLGASGMTRAHETSLDDIHRRGDAS
jgi:hypothetical protein